MILMIPSNPETSPAVEAPSGLLAKLARNRKQTGYALLIVAVLFALIPLWMVYHYKYAAAKATESSAAEEKKSPEEAKPAPETQIHYVPVMIWGGALALIFMGAGVWYLLSEETGGWNPADATRLIVLTIGGLSGLVTVLLIGLALPYFEWWSIFIGGVESWRKEWWRIGITMLALFGGLALMFVSLQLARTDERSSPGLRRLLYGYNAVLTGLLVLAILTVLNVLTYVPLPAWGSFFSKPSDWTASSIYTLSPASKNLLSSIDQPLRIYVLLTKRDPFYNEVENLMGNCRAVNRQLEVDYVPPDSRRATASELIRKYALTESMGILVVYTKEGREEHEFIPRDDLGTADRSSPDKFSFKGEDELMKKLRLLTEGKSRATVYFAQGDGELELNDSNTAAPDRGLGVLKERLERANYQVKELLLTSPTLDKIPEDAAILVIARPARPLSPKALNALRSYVNPTSKDAKKGKLVILFDVVTGRDQNFVQTGLENFVQEFNVRVNNDRILAIRNDPPPLQVVAVANPNARNALAEAFAGEPPYIFSEVRSLDVASAQPNGPFNPYTAEVFFLAAERNLLLEPPPLHGDPINYLEGLLKGIDTDENRRKELEAMLVKKLPAVAITVTQPKEPDAAADVHARMRGMKQEPRLVVFGDASWVANQGISRQNSGRFELFVSVLNWLRESPEIGKMADEKERKFYTLGATPEGIVRLEWLPGFLICLTIIGLGGGIWIVRRR
jgi:hypothetical protein